MARPGRRGPRGPLVRLNPDFWGNVAVGAPDECWPWQRGRAGGYGILHLNGKTAYAHRRAYELTHGEIPADLYICHKCDNPPCCNPAHLWPGTAKENTQDSIAKGRHGARKRQLERAARQRIRYEPRRKVNAVQAGEIRAAYAAGGITYRELAARYGITESYVCRIVKGERRTKEAA